MSERATRGGIFLVLVATFGLALKGIWARLAYAQGLDVAGVVFYRSALAAPLSVLMGLWLLRRLGAPSTERPERQKGDWLRAIALGVFFPLGMWSDFQAISYLGAGVSRVILFGFPLVVMIIDASLTRIWPSRSRLWGFALAWFGLMGVASGQGGSPGDPLRWTGLLWGVVALFSYAIFVWFSGRLAPRLGSVQMTITTQLATAAVVVVGVLISGDFRAPAINESALGFVALMVVVSTIGPYFLLTEGIARLGAARASLLAMFGPTVTLMAGAIVLDESLTAIQWLGAAATLLGVRLSQRR